MHGTDEHVLSFGPFDLFPGQRQLIKDGVPVRLGSRALDILLALTARAGEIVSKDELIAFVWPNTFVEEANLRVHMVSLRKALDDDGGSTKFITNVPGRGYCFVSPVTRGARGKVPVPPAKAPPAAPSLVPSNSAGRVIGREAVVEAIAAQLPQRRLITVAGPGGIGKTTVALSVVEALSGAYGGGVVFLDLAPVSDPALLPRALGSALEYAGHSPSSVDDIAAFLRARDMLIVLDNCEHVIEAAAVMAESLLRSAPGLHILATSREPLRVTGEWVQRLPSLDVPPPTAALDAQEAMRYSAVRLFVARASESLGGYELTDADAPLVAELCRRLDGIALAIELAAGRVDMIGVRGLAESLDDCFRLLTRGRRTALPRHQTLRATLDWSYRILPAEEQAALRRLAIFNGGFFLPAAHALAGEGSERLDMDEAVASLVAKSLVTAEAAGGTVRYRLLETTRAYGLEKLRECGEEAAFAGLHARTFEALFQRAAAQWETQPTRNWLETYACELGNLRAALDWAFSESGVPGVGVALTVAAVPLWFQLSLVEECLLRVRTAIGALEETSEQHKRWRMQLSAALGWPQMRGIAGVPTGSAAWRATLAIAEEIGDVDFQARALWALWVDRTNNAEPRAALDLADRYCALTAGLGDIADESIGWRMRGRSLHLLGQHEEGRRAVDRMLNVYAAPTVRSHLVRFQYEQRITARITRGRTLWLLGFPDLALEDIRDNIEGALAYGHVPTLCHALSDSACPITLLAGELEAAGHYVSLQRTYTNTSALDVWNTHCDCYAGDLLMQRGEGETGLAMLRVAMGKLAQAGYILYQTAFFAAYARGQLATGRPDEGLEIVDRALAQCARTGEAWLLPELHCIRGDILLSQKAAYAPLAAETAYLQGLHLAHDQSALSLELRCATSLARLRREQGRSAEVSAILEPVISRFTEGFSTPDMRAAAALLAS
ncbi:MAG: hypothetical protein B7Y12_00610 [Rhizobiales bacterium 24-66-13]|jgi:predicted ATPase|nr:MAG: hypothetical protein B7Y95_04230 [Rhizobiales bacterium 32-66-11]OYY14014.1 MAG: hypothetical protein B7Y70_00095 [Rhizobiales bacterium 35-68-8]OYZ83104.1 MAG: hypothetical protein B7Y12_00610 [Rhizobiales bacterium 24-66-13]OZB12035.1 MAG: hypothetical protein B7X67_01195 [Rhizobiales bacterium 39-66-18]HQS45631.1 winged helix-turn-helix domain-containing protein [Xanthobacteraceae bacterium]